MNSEKNTTNSGKMPNLMHQLDLTTGYHAIHRIDTFSRPLLENYRNLLPYGGVVPIFEGQFSVSIKRSRFTLFHHYTPIHEGGIGIGCDSTWMELNNLIKSLGWTLEAEPRDGLWLAELPLASIYELKNEPINWVFDFARHLAVAMIESGSIGPI
jgi:hypothetical protein